MRTQTFKITGPSEVDPIKAEELRDLIWDTDYTVEEIDQDCSHCGGPVLAGKRTHATHCPEVRKEMDICVDEKCPNRQQSVWTAMHDRMVEGLRDPMTRHKVLNSVDLVRDIMTNNDDELEGIKPTFLGGNLGDGDGTKSKL